jgi:hypothetical protein
MESLNEIKRLFQVIINEKNSPGKGSSALPLGQRILNTSTVGRIHRSEKLVEICSRFGADTRRDTGEFSSKFRRS